MGFSVSGASAIILLAGVLAFSMAFTAISNGHERVSAAEDDRMEQYLEQRNSNINITLVNSTAVQVNNTGSITLNASETALITDGTYEEPASFEVENDPDTTVWAPGEQLNMTLANTDPNRVKVVAETGIADTKTGVN
jgi:flagellar protein FlaF